MIDSHAHLYLSKESLETLIAASQEAGVSHIVNIGINVDSSKETLAQRSQFPDYLSATVGIHPCETKDLARFDEIEQLAKSGDFVAIGEIGLDYHWMDAPKDIQQQCFERQLELAKQLNLPVVIHNRKSDEDVAAIVRNFPTVKKVFHCFSGSWEFAESLLSDTHFFSFTGQVTYAKKGKTVNTLKRLPVDKIMIETDSPYLTPKAYQGTANSPVYLPAIAEHIAAIRGIPVDDFVSETIRTTRSFFGID